MAIDPLASGAYVIPPTVVPVPPPPQPEPGAPSLDAARDRSDQGTRDGANTSSDSSGRSAAAPTAADGRGSLVDLQA